MQIFAKLGPLIVSVVLTVVVAAIVVNIVQAKLHPDANQRHFEAARDFRQVNARGMVNLLFKKPTSSAESSSEQQVWPDR